MAILLSISKSKTFGLESVNGQPTNESARDIISLSFCEATSRLALFGLDSEPYAYSLHAAPLYPTLRKPDGKPDYEAIYDAFTKEFSEGTDYEDFHLYEFAIKDLCEFPAVKVKSTERIMRTRRIASPKTRENAFEVAKRDIERGLKDNKRYIGVEE